MNLSDVKAIHIGSDEVIQISMNGTVMWTKPTPPVPTPDCLCFTNQTSTAGTITVSGSGRGFSASISYSSDNGDTWSGESVSSNTITLPANGKVYIKGDFTPDNDQYAYTYSCDVDYALSGNLLSLLDSTNYASETYIHSFAFKATFRGDTHLVDITGLNLGVATGVGDEAMIETFYGTSITTGMDLRQIDTIYYSQSVFDGLYENCSNLTTAYAPTDTVWGSGGGMAPNYYGWLNGVAASGTIYCSSQAVANAIPTGSVDGCPSGWTVSVQ